MRLAKHETHHARVIVVGGGVAGAAACIGLAREGLRALWLVREASPLSVDPVGESLSPAAVPVLKSLGVEEVANSARHRPANATFSSWGNVALMERNAFLHLEGPGRVVDRRFFEQQLRDAADGLATRIVGSLDGIALRENGSGWLLTVDNGEVLSADFLIDATGRSSVIGRRFSRFERIDKLVAAVAFLRQRNCDVEPTRATLIEAVAQGWWYATLLPDKRLGLSFFSDPDLLPRDLSRDLTSWRQILANSLYAGRWVEDAEFELETPPRLVSAGSARLEPPCGGGQNLAGWAAIGDAAAAFDPLSSHGLTTALWTAARMGKVASAWLSGDREPLTAYGQAVASGFAAFLRQREAIYKREQRFASEPFWKRRNA